MLSEELLIIHLYYTVFEIAALVILLIRFRKQFWAKLIVAGLLINLSVAIFLYIPGFPGLFLLEVFSLTPVLSLLVSLDVYSYVLIYLGIASAPIAKQPDSEQECLLQYEALPNRMTYKARSLLLTTLLLLVSLNIYWFFWLYHNIRELRQLGSQKLSFTPGQAVGYMFIPVINVGWAVKIILIFPQAIQELNNRLLGDRSGSFYSAGFVSLLFFCTIIPNSVHAILSLSSSFLLTSFFLFELLFLTAIVYTQRYINKLWLGVRASQKQN